MGELLRVAFLHSFGEFRKLPSGSGFVGVKPGRLAGARGLDVGEFSALVGRLNQDEGVFCGHALGFVGGGGVAKTNVAVETKRNEGRLFVVQDHTKRLAGNLGHGGKGAVTDAKGSGVFGEKDPVAFVDFMVSDGNASALDGSGLLPFVLGKAV